jgi:hypothetical protein
MTVTLGIATPIVTRTATSPDWITHGVMEDVAHVVAEADRLGYDFCTCSEHIGIPDAELARRVRRTGTRSRRSASSRRAPRGFS